MAQITSIEWTERTWNPVRGCRKISPGCKHCYAERFAERFRGSPGNAYELGFDPRLAPDALAAPLRLRSPTTIFVNSMSDLFLDEVPDEYIAAVGKVMVLANWHVYQVLTKRADRLRGLLSGALKFAAAAPNIWWGVSVEDRAWGLPRIEELRRAPAAVRFLSVEPLLEDLGRLKLKGIDWVIVGGESGPGARPMEKEWVVSIRDQCMEQGVRFFFKQWGGVFKKKAGRRLQGHLYNQLPARVTGAVLDERERRAALVEVEKLAAEWRGRELLEPPKRRRSGQVLPVVGSI